MKARAGRLARACALATAMLVAGCVTPPPAEPTPVPVRPSQPVAPLVLSSGVVLHQPRPGLLTAGQPELDDWTRLAALGVETVINLRPADEMNGRDEAAEVRAAGLAYVHIPVAGAGAVTAANARALREAIAVARGQVLVHCASGNRAGALLALAAHADGMQTADALAFGKRAGLSSLEPVVREKLGLPAIACGAAAAGSRC